MAPEQADLDALPDARWDVYAVGSLLYHMLTGNPPHRNDGTQKQLESAESLEARLKMYQAIIRKSGLPTGHRSIAGVDKRLAEIIDRCLAVSPEYRLPNAQAVRDELDARDRQRSRRPLLMLGVVAPILLMAAMVPIFVNALTRNLRVTEEEITIRALESDALSARLQAAALEDELNDRLEELEGILSNEEIAAKLEETMLRKPDEVLTEMTSYADAPMAERPRWMQLLDTAWERTNTANVKRERSLDASWFLTDATGVQIWRRSFSNSTLGEMFNYRDYFHGRGIDYSDNEVPADISPLQSRHVSVAYKSKTTDRQTVAMSVPVKDKQGAVIGVFARSTYLGMLQSRLGRRMLEVGDNRVHRIIALAEFRDSGELRLLDHPYLTEKYVKSAEALERDIELFQTLKMDETIAVNVQETLRADPSGRSEVKLKNYLDPVGQLTDSAADAYRGNWMAAMAPVRGTGWMVIVQERSDDALSPVKAMADRASRQAWLAVLIAVAMMGLVWFFVWRAFGRVGNLHVNHAAE
jgi:hypothetical protein